MTNRGLTGDAPKEGQEGAEEEVVASKAVQDVVVAEVGVVDIEVGVAIEINGLVVVGEVAEAAVNKL